MTQTAQWRQTAQLLEDAASMLKCAADSIDHYEQLLRNPRMMMPSSLDYNCGLSVRAYKVLIMLGCRTPYDITKFDASTLKAQKNCGESTVIEIRVWLGQYGLCLAGENP